MKKTSDAKNSDKKRKLLDKTSKLNRLILTDRQLFDLELILSGGFHPLKGFLEKKDYESVVKRSKLKDGSVWPMPIVLDVSREKAKDFSLGSEVLLCDSFNNPIAILKISSIYEPDKKQEAQMVYGTTDELHPGVKYLFKNTGDVYLGGAVLGIEFSPKYDFKELRFGPKELKEKFKKEKKKKVIAFQTRNPIHKAHFEIIKRAAEEHKAHILIHPVVGLTKGGDIDYVTRVKAYKALLNNEEAKNMTLALLPLAMRMAGPREALWHALIRKNHGATHFIIGRDHAGPGNDSKGVPFYGPYDAQKYVKKFSKSIGIIPVFQPEMVYVEEVQGYVPSHKVKNGHTVKNISGTKFREMLLNGIEIPEWFSFKNVVEELKKGVKRQKGNGLVIFFTGLSGSGKSTIANILKIKLEELTDRQITLLDGDVVRNNLSKGLGFSKEDRNTNVERIGFVANIIANHGGIAICSAIAPYEEARQKNRELISQSGKYIEVFVSTPASVCEKRDVKGLYKKARLGLITGFTGVNDPYEEPKNAEIVLDTTKITAEKSAEKIIDYLKNSFSDKII